MHTHTHTQTKKANKTKKKQKQKKENIMLSFPKHEVMSLHPRLQSMIGYSIHPPFIGHSNGLHPLKTIPQSKL